MLLYVWLLCDDCIMFRSFKFFVIVNMLLNLIAPTSILETESSKRDFVPISKLNQWAGIDLCFIQPVMGPRLFFRSSSQSQKTNDKVRHTSINVVSDQIMRLNRSRSHSSFRLSWIHIELSITFCSLCSCWCWKFCSHFAFWYIHQKETTTNSWFSSFRH